MSTTIGVDTSHWSGVINFVTMYNAGAKFWITKASDAFFGTGQLFQDSMFDTYMRDSEDIGLLRGCYHWLQPSVDPTVAAKFYLERYYKYDLDFPPILDFEEPKVTNYGDFAWRAEVWLRYVYEQTKKKPIVYTAKWYTDRFAQKYISWMNVYPLWVADYTWWSNNVTHKPIMPYPWTEHTIWQWGTPARGNEFGVQAKEIDMNYFNGSYDDLLSFLNAEKPEPPVQSYLFDGVVEANALSIRTGPSTDYPVSGYLKKGDVVHVKEVDGQNVWVEHDSGWSAMKVGANEYIGRKKS